MLEYAQFLQLITLQKNLNYVQFFVYQIQIIMQNKLNKTTEKQFPLQNIQYEALQADKKSVIKKLLYLYIFYASKGSKHSYSELQQHNYMELLSQVWSASAKPLSRNKGMWKQLQILYFTKGSKNKFGFKNFLDMLPSLSYYFEPDLNQQESLKSLIYHFNSVYQSKVIPQIQHKLIDTREVIAQDTRAFLSKLVPDLVKLYKVYFPHQITLKSRAKEFKSMSFDCFTLLLKEFQIHPKLISARQIFYIFNQACQLRQSDLIYDSEESRAVIHEMGEILTLSKFIQALIVISKRAFPKLKNIENQQDWQDEQKFILRTLLEYMETVKMCNKRKTKYIHERMCFIVLQEHPPEEMIKTIQVKDKIIKQSTSNMSFYGLLDKIKF